MTRYLSEESNIKKCTKAGILYGLTPATLNKLFEKFSETMEN